MTAPVATPIAAPVAPVETPVAPTQATPQITPVFPSKAEPVGLNAMIDKIAREGHAESAPTETPVVAPTEGTETPPPAPVTIGSEGEIKVDGEDITLRAERNADGTFKTQIDPNQKFDIEIKDPETGEPRKYTKSMPEILRMARDGVWGQKVKDEVAYYRKEVPQWVETHQALTSQVQEATQRVEQVQATVSDLQSQLEAQMALNRELLTAPDEFVIQRREEFAQEMSPEKRLAKLEEKLAKDRETAQMTERQQALVRQADSFIQTRLAPVLAEAEKALGSTDFARKLVAGQIALATTPLLRNGQIPPEAWPQIAEYVQGPFQQWVKEVSAFQQTQAANSEALRKSQVVAQVAVNSAGQVLRPVGSVQGSFASAPSGPPKDMKDAMARIINRPLANTG